MERFQLFAQYISKLPIPDATEEERAAVAELARQITGLARERYGLHERVRRRITGDLGGGRPLNQKLTAWWERDFTEFRAEVAKHFKRDIALRDRDEWEEWLAAQRERHAGLTAAIVERETRLNALVYGLFGLGADEIALVERSTRYDYGKE